LQCVKKFSCNKIQLITSYPCNQLNILMSFFRVLFAIIFPPLSVIDKGCGSFCIIFLLTLCGWIPGVIGALVILNNPKN
jgi:uncharacterized membrane protein YqaE (UPF0057 family)